MYERFKSQKAEERHFTSMAPMADIVFLLLIFFMLTSSFILEPGIDIDLPRVASAEDQIRQKHVLTITRDHTLMLDQDIVSFSTLSRVLTDTYADTESKLLIIRADRNVPHGLVVQALDISRQVGIAHLAIATEKIE